VLGLSVIGLKKIMFNLDALDVQVLFHETIWVYLTGTTQAPSFEEQVSEEDTSA